MKDERRRDIRVSFGEDILINNSMKVRALTISEGGLYVHTGRFFPVGTIVDVSFRLAGEKLSLKARVQHSQHGIGMGLMFADLTESDRERLTHYIKDRPCATVAGDRVLVVDDNASDRTMYKSKLILDGLCVFEAATIKAALEVLEREHINLLVVNPYMAKSEGFGLLASVAEHPDFKCVIRLALAPRGTPEDMKKADEAGVTEYLLRMSTSPAKLSERVKAYLKK